MVEFGKWRRNDRNRKKGLAYQVAWPLLLAQRCNKESLLAPRVHRARVHQVQLLRLGPLAIVVGLKMPCCHNAEGIQEERLLGWAVESREKKWASGKERERNNNWRKRLRPALNWFSCSCNMVLCNAFLLFWTQTDREIERVWYGAIGGPRQACAFHSVRRHLRSVVEPHYMKLIWAVALLRSRSLTT